MTGSNTAVVTSVYLALNRQAGDMAKAAATQIVALQGRLVTDIVEIGRALIAAKDAVGHGNFLPWLREEFGWTERTAQSYIAVAERLGEKAKHFSHLPLTTVYKLAAPSTPDEVRAAIVNRLEGGEIIAPADISSEIQTARQARDLEAREAAKSPASRRAARATQARQAAVRTAAFRAQQAEQASRAAARAEASRLLGEWLSAEQLAQIADIVAKAGGYISTSDIAVTK